MWFICRKLTSEIGEYDCITSLQEREVFQRVQLGVPLKVARKPAYSSTPTLYAHRT